MTVRVEIPDKTTLITQLTISTWPFAIL